MSLCMGPWRMPKSWYPVRGATISCRDNSGQSRASASVLGHTLDQIQIRTSMSLGLGMVMWLNQNPLHVCSGNQDGASDMSNACVGRLRKGTRVVSTSSRVLKCQIVRMRTVTTRRRQTARPRAQRSTSLRNQTPSQRQSRIWRNASALLLQILKSMGTRPSVRVAPTCRMENRQAVWDALEIPSAQRSESRQGQWLPSRTRTS